MEGLEHRWGFSLQFRLHYENTNFAHRTSFLYLSLQQSLRDNRSGSSLMRIPHHRTLIFSKSFTVTDCPLWNSLPSHLKIRFHSFERRVAIIVFQCAVLKSLLFGICVQYRLLDKTGLLKLVQLTTDTGNVNRLILCWKNNMMECHYYKYWFFCQVAAICQSGPSNAWASWWSERQLQRRVGHHSIKQSEPTGMDFHTRHDIATPSCGSTAGRSSQPLLPQVSQIVLGVQVMADM